jgi:hypothetical protein
MIMAVSICFQLFRHIVFFAAAFAWEKTGNRIAARIAMIAITTSNSIRVKARVLASMPDIVTQNLAIDTIISPLIIYIPWLTSASLAPPCRGQSIRHDDPEAGQNGKAQGRRSVGRPRVESH